MSTSVDQHSLPRELVLASAGSGKTYHLSSRIIGLLASGAPANEVLASTFTRKASGEILERVLIRLAEAALDPEKALELGEATGADDAQPEVYRRLLARLLRDLHQMNVGTLDAFLVRVARAFFQELGLSPGWTMADGPMQERLRTEAVQTALAGADRAEIIELLRMINRGDASRQVHDSLLDKVDHLLRLRRQLAPSAVDAWSPNFGVTEQVSDEDLRVRASEIATRLLEIDVPSNKNGSPNQNWIKARASASTDIAGLDWIDVFGKGIGGKVIQGEELFSSHPIEPEFVDVFDQARGLARIQLAPRLRRETEALGRLAELLENAFVAVQRRAGAYRFEDITYLLGGPDPTGSREDLYYRLDQQIRHLLLDEFQDTSLDQWRALGPLAEELLSGHLDERAGVIVADTKQSIYGWRGARPELVRKVGEQFGLANESLQYSWRSSHVVLDFVASVFKDFAANEVVERLPGGSSVAKEWMKDFTELEAARDLRGHVCVHLAPSDNTTAAIQPMLLARAAKIVQALHTQMPEKTIGVLVRRNAVVGHLMDELRELHVLASGEGGTSLTDTAPANAILSLIRLADHPGDRVARYHVATTPLGPVVGLTDRKDADRAGRLSLRVRRQLLSDGYGPTLALWVRDLAPHCNSREVQRLLQLVELGHRWDERPTLRPADFVRYVAGEAVEDPSSAPVQVMTIHRSKGLEFDVVVLPELYQSLKPQGRGVAIPERDPRNGQIVRVYPRVRSRLLPLFPEVEHPLGEIQATEIRDGLSLLYVALTRARNALHLIVPPEGGSTAHSAALIRAALGLEDAEASDTGVLFEEGAPDWSEGEAPPPQTSARPSTVEPGCPLLRPSEAGSDRNLARRSPSSLEGGTGVDLEFVMRLDNARAFRRGTVVHAWCERIEWIEDGIPDDEVLEQVVRSVAPGMPQDQADELLVAFRGWLEVESTRRALSPSAYDGDPDTVLRVENEIPFARRVAGEIQEGFIDRLVLIERDGKVVGAEILDFKTDNIGSDDEAELNARAEYYRPQIEAYCEVVREQYELAEEEVRGKLLFLRAGAIRDVR